MDQKCRAIRYHLALTGLLALEGLGVMTAFALGVDIDQMLVATGVGPVTLMRGPEDCRGEVEFVRHGIHILRRNMSSLHRGTWNVSGNMYSPYMGTCSVVRKQNLPQRNPFFSQVCVHLTGMPFSGL